MNRMIACSFSVMNSGLSDIKPDNSMLPLLGHHGRSEQSSDKIATAFDVRER